MENISFLRFALFEPVHSGKSSLSRVLNCPNLRSFIRGSYQRKLYIIIGRILCSFVQFFRMIGVDEICNAGHKWPLRQTTSEAYFSSHRIVSLFYLSDYKVPLYHLSDYTTPLYYLSGYTKSPVLKNSLILLQIKKYIQNITFFSIYIIQRKKKIQDSVQICYMNINLFLSETTDPKYNTPLLTNEPSFLSNHPLKLFPLFF